MKYWLKYLCFLFLMGIGFILFLSLFNTKNVVDIGNELILKIINLEFTEKELKMPGVQFFLEDLENQNQIYVPLDFCNLINMKDEDINNNVNYQDGIDNLNTILIDKKNVIIDSLKTKLYNDNIQGYKLYDNTVYVQLNMFEYSHNYLTIEINGGIFQISTSLVPTTFLMYIKQIIKNNNLFELKNIEKNKNIISYNFNGLINNYNITLINKLNLFGYSKDIKIDFPGIKDYGVCKFLEE